MQFLTKVILWVTFAHFFALMIISTFSKQKTPHTYKTENIQGLLYTPEKIVTSINLLSPDDIVFANLDVFNNRSVFRALAAYPHIRNNPLDASTENKTNAGTENGTLSSDISAGNEPISLGPSKENEPLSADANAGNDIDASDSDTEKENLPADDDTVPLKEVTDNDTQPAENGAIQLNKGAENDTAPLDDNLTPLVSQGLIPEDDYCFRVDHYNLQHLDNMFKEKHFFTNFLPGAIRRQVLNDVGKVLLRGKKGANLLDKRVTTFFTNSSDYHNHREIGKDFLCATQMYNHIPGSQNLTTKDRSLDLYSSYVAKYNGSQECLNSGLPALPKSYRLHVKEECEAFFEIVNSEEYQNISDSTPLQYLIKPGNDSHRGQGIELFTKEMRSRLNEIYDAGNDCGYWQKSLIAQSYVSNPMLLNLRNKFDFKVYMLVASTNPLIVYYHDGYLRASLSEYNKTLLEKGVHITNTQANVEKFDETVERLEGFATEEEVKRQQLWTFEDFEDMLINMGTIQARGWLSEYLRPTFQKAMVHVARMSKEAFSKESNVFQLFGLDFLIDEDMKVWYLEANDNVHFRLDTEKIAGLTIIMLKDMFDIQYAYYRARMKRVVNIIRHVEKEMKEKGSTDFYKWQEEYQEAVQNKLDPEYKIRNDNSFRLIIDENLKGADVYKGHLPKGCF